MTFLDSDIKIKLTNYLRRAVVMSWVRSAESQNKAHSTMIEKYGGYTFQSEILRSKICDTLVSKYGVDNPMKLKEFSEKAVLTKNRIWEETVLREFPMKQHESKNVRYKAFNEDEMSVYILSEKMSVQFLSENGHLLKPNWGKFHTSVALIKDNVVYQVLRFEKHKQNVVLVNFGTKSGFFNPNEYTKLMDYSFQLLGLDDFTMLIPRSLATLPLIYSLSVEFVCAGLYDVFWVVEDNSLKKLTRWDNIAEMKEKYNYVTSDFLDLYQYKRQAGRHLSLLDELF